MSDAFAVTAMRCRAWVPPLQIRLRCERDGGIDSAGSLFVDEKKLEISLEVRLDQDAIRFEGSYLRRSLHVLLKNGPDVFMAVA